MNNLKKIISNVKEKIKKSKIHAVFVVAPIDDGYAATTRPGSDKIGLPGGKVDPNEDLLDALYRECKEEGFEIDGVEKEPFHIQKIEGKHIAWFRAKKCKILKNYKEEKRITALVANLSEIKGSGMGNDIALKKY